MDLKKQKKITQRGFSLMEVMIVVGIISLMTAVGLVSLSETRARKQLNAETRQVIAVIKEAQNNALTGKVPEAGKYPCSFTVEMTDADSYNLKYKYKSSVGDACTDPADTAENAIAGYELNYGITFAGTQEIAFDVPFGGLGGNYFVELSSNSDDNRTQFFCVCQSGAILDSLDAEDCGACQNQ